MLLVDFSVEAESEAHEGVEPTSYVERLRPMIRPAQ